MFMDTIPRKPLNLYDRGKNMSYKLKIYEEMIANNPFKDRKLVLGEGNINSRIMLIGEAPGAQEEAQGRPFVGKAGENLNAFLKIMELNREDLYISNVVKLRPFKLSAKTNKPINRPPNSKEVDFFTEYLLKEIEEINPEIVVTLGNFALKAVLQDKNAVIGNYHGKFTRCNGRELFPLYHPASVIYNRSLQEVYIEDINRLKVLL